MKDVISCDKLRVGAHRGRERKIDFLSSGERKGKSPNQRFISGVADRT